MPHNKTPVSATTVSVDTSIRDEINKEAERLGLSQRQMVTRLFETYILNLRQDESPKDDGQIVNEIYAYLDKVVKRDDRIIAFIKEQEKVLLTPILSSVQATEARVNTLIEILSNLD